MATKLVRFLIAYTSAFLLFMSLVFVLAKDQSVDDHAIVAFDKLVQSDPRVENVCLTVRDGMMLAWKRP